MFTVIRAVRLGVTAIALTVWVGLGLVFWIPLLTKMTAYFMTMITVDSFSRKVDIKNVQKRLNFAIEFYIYGFRRILEVLDSVELAPETLESIEPIDVLHFLRLVLLDFIWTIFFWSSFGFLLWRLVS